MARRLQHHVEKHKAKLAHHAKKVGAKHIARLKGEKEPTLRGGHEAVRKHA